MKLVYHDISELLEIDKGEVYNLVVENPKFFYEIVRDLKVQIEGFDGKWILSENDNLLSLKNKCDLVIDFIDFKANKKSLTNKVLHLLNEFALDNKYIDETTKLLSKIERYIYCLSENLDVDVICDAITIQQITKAVGISVVLDGESLVEQIYSYMKVVREVLGEKLFIFINLKAFVPKNELEWFCKTVKVHDYSVLFFDNKIYDLNIGGKQLIIDNDLCEI